MPNSQKGFAPIILIFIVIAIVGGIAAVFLNINKGKVVTVEDSKLDSLMPKLTKQQAVEKVKQLPEVQEYLKSKPDISENETLNKTKDGLIYIRRDVGSEYFKKVGSTILVIFVYDNGDQIIDSTEQKVMYSLSI